MARGREPDSRRAARAGQARRDPRSASARTGWFGGRGLDVAIIGAGALGTLLASRLSAVTQPPGNGAAPADPMVTAAAPLPLHDVRVLVRTAARAETLRREAPQAHPVGDPSELGRPALLFLCVKSYQTEGAIETLEVALEGASRAAVVSLQNGWGHMDRLAAAFPATALVAGATTLGAYWDDRGAYHVSVAGLTAFAPWNSAGAAATDAAVELFHSAALRAERADHARDLLWRKLVLNVAVNPLTAIRRVRNGALLEDAALHAAAVAAALEAVGIGVTRGHLLDIYDPVPPLNALLRDTAENRSSMAEDVAHGRRTEADAIVGAILREGEAAGLPTPVAASLAERLERPTSER